VVGDHRGEVSFDITRYGNVSLGVRPAALWLEDAEVRGDTIRIRGSAVGRDPETLAVELTPRGHRGDRRLPTGADEDGRVTIELPLDGWSSALGTEVLPAGTYELQAAEVRPAGPPAPVEVRTRRSLIDRFPLDHASRARPAHLDDLSWQRPALIVGDGLRPDERGRFNQRRLWSEAVATREVDPSLVVLLAADGRGSGSDVGAIADELLRSRTDLRLVGAVADGQAVWPEGVASVRFGSATWFRALADAGTVITASPLPQGFSRAGGQRVVRTWDGPPVRSLGLLVPSVANGHERYRDSVRREAAAWTHLLAADAASEAVLRRAYEPSGDVLLARPALDRVASEADRAAIGAQLRRQLGLDAATRVVLWASTWSSDERHPGGAYRATPDLDVVALADALPEDVVVLARSHPKVADRLHDRDVSERIRDVSAYRWLVDLLVLADVVVAPPTSIVTDARALGVPAVILDPGGMGSDSTVGPRPLVDLEATVVEEAAALAPAVAALLGSVGTTVRAGEAPAAPAGDDVARVLAALFPK
jgi:hypothetical protein